jgi:hypothetical protein
LQLFLAQKEVHLKEREEARQQRQEKKRQTPTERQEQYQAFMRAALLGDNSRDACAEATKLYCAMQKRPAASSSDVQRTPTKNVSKEAALTPDKDVAPPSRSASSSTKK